MRWTRYAGARLLQSVIVVAMLTVMSFVMVRLIPGDPAERIAPQDASDEYIQDLRRQLGLDRPAVEQFVDYVANAMAGDFGNSFVSGERVFDIVLQRLPYTLALALSALFVLLLIGFVVGLSIAIATRGGRFPGLERAYVSVAALIGAIPELIVAISLTVIFAVTLRWFPISGAGSLSAIVLPTLAVALRSGANLSRFVRAEADTVLRSDYIRTSRSKRLPSHLIYRRHLLPNVATAAIVVAGLLFPSIIGGAVIVENVFAWPGLGLTVVRAVSRGDYPLVQGCVVFFGVVVALSNLTVDIVITLLDPRSAIIR